MPLSMNPALTPVIRPIPSGPCSSPLRNGTRMPRRFPTQRASSPQKINIYVILLISVSPALMGLLLVSQQVTKIHTHTPDQGRHSLPTPSCHAETLCCFPWSPSTDHWWTHHFQYRLGPQNRTHTCFVKIANEHHLSFLARVHKAQWTGDCHFGVQTLQISSGYAAALMSVARSFYAAVLRGKLPFQITKHHQEAFWNFVPHNVTNHWAYCPSKDINCYFLPLSHCPAVVGRDTADRGAKPSTAKAQREFAWLRQYAFRPNHVLRRKLVDFRNQHTEVPSGISACAALHVRRSDIAFGKGRRYAPVIEYLERGNVSKGDTVVLLTDDESTIDEVNHYLRDDYRWIYLVRPRFRGATGGFEGFVPSLDPSLEVLSILTEVQLAGQCHTLVHGKSGFVAVIAEEMERQWELQIALEGPSTTLRTYNSTWTPTSKGTTAATSVVTSDATTAVVVVPWQLIYLDTQQDKRQQPKMDPILRAESYLQHIDEYYAQRGYSRMNE